MNVTAELNTEKICGDIERRIKNAQLILSENALKDCNRLCRKMSGKLAQSAEKNSDLEKGQLIWKASYARRAYYTGTPLTSVNPEARLMWAHRAAERNVRHWLRIIRREFER